MQDHATYSNNIREGFDYLLANYPEVFVMGQGVWSPWYVGSTLSGLDKQYGTERIIDTPVSESACTGAAIGAAISGMRPIVIHPRMDFMLYAADAIVNQAAKWRYMFGGQSQAPVTIRAIINRGGEQGAQHSQSLHSWFAHIPGIKVVAPYTAEDARDLLVMAVLSNDPVIYIDDRWLYDLEAVGPGHSLDKIDCFSLSKVRPQLLHEGTDCTIVSYGYGCRTSLDAAKQLFMKHGISCDVIDLRVVSPVQPEPIVESVNKTGRLLVVDYAWSTCGVSSEIIALVVCHKDCNSLKSKPSRLTLPEAPAPSSTAMETVYYPSSNKISEAVMSML